MAAVYLSYGILKLQRISFTLYALLSVAMLHFTLIGEMAIEFGQPQIFVTFLIVGAFWALQSGHSRVAGLIWGLAAAIKIAPGYLAVIFLMERRWRALAYFSTVCIELAGISATYLLTRQLPDGKRIWFRLHIVFLKTFLVARSPGLITFFLSILLLPSLFRHQAIG